MPILDKLEPLADAVLAREAVNRPVRRRHAADLAVLAYHQVEDPGPLSRHLDHLCAHFAPVSLADVSRSLRDGEALGEHSVLITFDDGDRSVVDVAAPLLAERGIPAVAFVVTSLLGTDAPFWWDEVAALVRVGATAPGVATAASDPIATVRSLKQLENQCRLDAIEALRTSAPVPAPSTRQLDSDDLRRLERYGIEIGNHTHTHPCLDHCDVDTIEAEVRSADAVIEAALGHRPAAFAYPNGDVDDRVVEVLRRCGHHLAFTFDHRLATWPPADPLRVSRVRVDASTSLHRFRAIVSGLHPALHHLRGRS